MKVCERRWCRGFTPHTRTRHWFGWLPASDWWTLGTASVVGVVGGVLVGLWHR